MGFRIRVAFYGLVAATAIVCAGAASPALGQVTQTVLYRFLAGSDGSTPVGALIADARGTLYGTTQFFGAFPADCSGSGAGCGVVFKLTPPRGGEIAWSETTLHSFSGGSDGSVPQAGLFARNKSASPNKPLYGTTSSAFGPGFGTVFKLVDGTLTTLWSFSGGSDGANPAAGLIADRNGVLYGTTENGGAIGFGVVFKLMPPAVAGQTPWAETVLWTFTEGSDGGFPVGDLIADHTGALFGTAQFGGAITPNNLPCPSGCGVVFRLTGTGFATNNGG